MLRDSTIAVAVVHIVPTSNTASHDNHEKINSWVSFDFHIWDAYGAPLGGPMGRWRAAIIIFLNFILNFKLFPIALTSQAVENDLKVAAQARKEVENQAQRMLAQGMETQVRINCRPKVALVIRSVLCCFKAALSNLEFDGKL